MWFPLAEQPALRRRPHPFQKIIHSGMMHVKQYPMRIPGQHNMPPTTFPIRAGSGTALSWNRFCFA